MSFDQEKIEKIKVLQDKILQTLTGEEVGNCYAAMCNALVVLCFSTGIDEKEVHKDIDHCYLHVAKFSESNTCFLRNGGNN